MKSTTNERYDYWIGCYKEHKASGETTRSFCQSRGLKEDSYRKALSRYNLSSPNQARQEAKSSKFIELTEKGACNDSIEIHYGLICIKPGANVSSATLKKTFKVLESLSLCGRAEQGYIFMKNHAICAARLEG
jgi:hypothetical protein